MEQRLSVHDRLTNDATSQTLPGICGVCSAGCGVNVHIVEGKIERLTPLKHHPLGIVCPLFIILLQNEATDADSGIEEIYVPLW